MVIPEPMQIMILATSTAALLVFVIGLLFYAKSISNRLKKSVNLINELYKLTQQLENKLADTDSHLSEASISNQERLMDLEAQTPKYKSFQENAQGQITHVKGYVQNLEQQVSELQTKMNKLSHQTELLAQEDPELKMYHHANEMAALGAGIEDIVDTCKLPRAEAEVLIAVHQRKPKAV